MENLPDQVKLKETSSMTYYFAHLHPLHPLSEVSYEDKPKHNCNSCGEQITGTAYRCEECDFDLHKVCAKDPVSLSPTSYASQISQLQQKSSVEMAVVDRTTSASFGDRLCDHQVKDVYSNLKYKCTHCHTSGRGKRRRCHECKVDVHPICWEHPTRISSFMHPQHELEMHSKKFFKACAICAGFMGEKPKLYRCKECDFYVHTTCIQLPQYLVHELHPPHHLQLKKMKRTDEKWILCDAECEHACKGWCYHCKSCDVCFHISCLLSYYTLHKSSGAHVDSVSALFELVNLASNLQN